MLSKLYAFVFTFALLLTEGAIVYASPLPNALKERSSDFQARQSSPGFRLHGEIAPDSDSLKLEARQPPSAGFRLHGEIAPDSSKVQARGPQGGHGFLLNVAAPDSTKASTA
ncbi:hypothetical protein MD484_g5936, partial [Candolleomyces efflorescens]